MTDTWTPLRRATPVILAHRPAPNATFRSAYAMAREAGEDPRSKPKRRSAKRAKERHPIAAALFPSDVEPGERALWDRVFNAPAVREIADEPVVLSCEVSSALVEVWGAGRGDGPPGATSDCDLEQLASALTFDSAQTAPRGTIEGAQRANARVGTRTRASRPRGGRDTARGDR